MVEGMLPEETGVASDDREKTARQTSKPGPKWPSIILSVAVGAFFLVLAFRNVDQAALFEQLRAVQIWDSGVLVVLVFAAVHFWRIRKDGGISGPL